MTEPIVERILITGAAGGVGTLMRPRLARAGRVLRLLDIAPLPAAAPGEQVETVRASVGDLDAMRQACTGVDVVIHLGGLSTEHPWDQVLETNINGTYTVFEAARRAGVPRVVFASSNHAVGFHPNDGAVAEDYAFPRPDTFYGVSKVAGRRWAVSTTTATGSTWSAYGSAPASNVRSTRGCCPPGCHRRTAPDCWRR